VEVAAEYRTKRGEIRDIDRVSNTTPSFTGILGGSTMSWSPKGPNLSAYGQEQVDTPTETLAVVNAL